MTSEKKRRFRFHYLETSFRLKKATLQKAFLTAVMKEEMRDFETIDYIFCTDTFLIGLNRQFLQHDTYTDILTFNLASGDKPVVAEIYISIERVKENAEKMKLAFRDEIDRVMVHGLMHLCGYNDHSDTEVTEMRNKENKYLATRDQFRPDNNIVS